MKILILGKRFNLAQGLKTKYTTWKHIHLHGELINNNIVLRSNEILGGNNWSFYLKKNY